MMDVPEKIIGYTAGIMRSGGFGMRGYEFLGRGKVDASHRANAMIITDRRILFIMVPLPGAGQMIEGADISMWQWLAARKDIENKLKEMLDNMSAQRILDSDQSNFALNFFDVREVKIRKFFGAVKFITKENKKYQYSIRDKKDLEKLKTYFKSLNLIN